MGRSSRSCNTDIYGFDYVSHETRAVPVRRRRLHLSRAVDGARHERSGPRVGKARGVLPLPKAVLAVILAELGCGPPLPVVVGEQPFLQAVEPTEGDAAQQCRLAARYRGAVFQIGDERARQHAVDRYELEAGLPRTNVR